MKKTKILGIILLAIVGLFTLTACGNKEGVANYTNFTNIVVTDPLDATVIPSTYIDVTNTLVGPATDTSLFDSTTGNGILRWSSESEGYDFTVTFTNWVASDKTPIEETNLYASDNLTPLGIKTAWTEWILLQIGTFTYHASNLFGLLGDTYLYWLGLLLMTLLIRTLAWPVYAKSNDMTLKMQLAQPELNRIQEKYKGRTDQASQQRMQMETMEAYKKYKINLWGCLMPLLQMPIFIAMYSVVQRFPHTPESTFGGVDGIMNTSFLWTHLGNVEMLPNLPLALIVGGTMFLSQWLMQRRQAAAQKNNRSPQSAQAKQTAKTMKFMMYFMVVMMAYIAIGNAGIAFYWIIGNCYQLLQSELNYRRLDAKKAKLAARM